MDAMEHEQNIAAGNPLYTACQKGDLSSVKALCTSQGYNIDTILSIAAGHVQRLQRYKQYSTNLVLVQNQPIKNVLVQYEGCTSIPTVVLVQLLV